MFERGYLSFAAIFLDVRGVHLVAPFKRNPKMGIFISLVLKMTLP